LQEYASNFDIVCLGETKLDEADEHNINEAFEGFVVQFKHRTKYKRKSGGIATLFKNEVCKYVISITWKVIQSGE